MTSGFVSGSFSHVYNNVYLRLAEGSKGADAAEKDYQAFPYVKLRTTSEQDPSKIEVYCNIIPQNSYLTKSFSVVTGSLNLFANSLNSMTGSNWMWNCQRGMTAQALDTACQRLSERLDELEKDERLLVEVKGELPQIRTILEESLRSVFYVYRTYKQMPEERVEETCTLGPQYYALKSQIERLEILEQKIDRPVQEFRIETAVVSDQRLVFKTEEAASSWFSMKLNEARTNSQVRGADVLRDLNGQKRLSKKVPEQFIKFARTLDAAFKDDIARYSYVSDIYRRFMEITVHLKLEIKAPNDFKELLCQLCEANAPREAYQLFFKLFLNERGNRPLGLTLEPAVINAILNDRIYFAMFDTI
jgi:hypothetical protein